MSSRSAKREAAEITRKAGNVFAQLGRPNADELLRKARVVNVINDVLTRRGLTQGAAAELAGVDQADISRLANGKLGRFSLDRLLTIVDRLGIEIGIEQRHDEHGHLVVEVRELIHA
jgi:predicted XRE-type DNA-binding protein